MRIAYIYDLVYPFSMGGVERRVSDLARGLAARGHEVHIFGTKQWPGPDLFTRDGIITHGVRCTSRTHSRIGRRSIWQALSFAIQLVRSLRGERFDVVDVQSMSPLSCLTALMLFRLSGTPVVVTWHEVWGRYWRHYMGPIGYLGMGAEIAMAKWGHSHIAVSRTTAARVRALGADDVSVIAGGVDVSEIAQAEPAWPLTDVICIGRLDHHKNVEALIDAARLLRRQGLEPTISIVGDGPCRDSLEKRARDLANVRFLGTIESHEGIWSLLKSSRLFVTPSTREGFGLAVLEALGCGVPALIVSHPDNAATELIDSGINGIVVSPDPSALAAGITTVLKNGETHSNLSANARATGLLYDSSITLERTESTYVGLCAGHGRAADSNLKQERRGQSPETKARA